MSLATTSKSATPTDLKIEEWIRRQTPTGSERYITEELKVFEEKFKASHEIEQLESQPSHW